MSNKVEYIILSPSGNITALVFAKRSVDVASKILNDDSRIEQVLFAYESSFENKIYWHGIMSGEEFCVNALRALGYYLLDGEDGDIDIFSSGINSLINIEIFNKSAIIKLGFKSLVLEDKLLEADTFLVRLSGITHVVVKENSKFYRLNIDNEYIEGLLDYFDLKNELAAGIMFLDKNDSLKPFVYVRDVESLFYETACGSGSIACSIVLKKYFNYADKIAIKQPSDFTLNISFENMNNLDSAYVHLSGNVLCLGKKEIEI